MPKSVIVPAAAGAAVLVAAIVADWIVPKIPGAAAGTMTGKIARYAVLFAVGYGAVWAAQKWA
jgi:hypothetical protein